eukprot:1159902-Pelagomonas_calceolata.AAC.10
MACNCHINHIKRKCQNNTQVSAGATSTMVRTSAASTTSTNITGALPIMVYASATSTTVSAGEAWAIDTGICTGISTCSGLWTQAASFLAEAYRVRCLRAHCSSEHSPTALHSTILHYTTIQHTSTQHFSTQHYCAQQYGRRQQCTQLYNTLCLLAHPVPLQNAKCPLQQSTVQFLVAQCKAAYRVPSMSI